MTEESLPHAQEAMIERHLVARGITDTRVIEAFRRVPRHRFVSEQDVEVAYVDSPLPIGDGQTISQPYMVALMTQTLEVEPGNRVLEIGTGSGYQTAILCELAGTVCSVERHVSLTRRASETLTDLGYTNFHLRVGDGTLGWPDQAPFDRILVTAAAPHVPPSLEQQLAPGGRMVIPVGGRYVQTLTLVVRNPDGSFAPPQDICDCMFVKLIGRDGYPET